VLLWLRLFGRTARAEANRASLEEKSMIKRGITCLLTLNLTLAATAFTAEPSPTPSLQPTSQPPVANSSSAETQAITQLDEDYEAAYKRGDANAVAAFYANDAEVIPNTGCRADGQL
jgi:hypothetical protein